MRLFILTEGICAFTWDYIKLFLVIQISKILSMKLKYFFDTHLTGNFVVNLPQLNYSVKWKFDYIIAREKRNE